MAEFKLSSFPNRSEEHIGGMVFFRPESLNTSSLRRSSLQRGILQVKEVYSEFIWNSCKLEGSPFTLPQVKTILENNYGDSFDEEQVLDLRNALNFVIDSCSENSFRLDKAHLCRINELVTKNETLEPGLFRGEGLVSPSPAIVGLSGNSVAYGLEPGLDGSTVNRVFQEELSRVAKMTAPVGLLYLASSLTRMQLFQNGNKRTSRLFLLGGLISTGWSPLMVPFSKQKSFNVCLHKLFTRNDATALMNFYSRCTL